MARNTCQSISGGSALGVRSINADVYGGDAKVAGNVDAGDGDETHDARIFDVLTEKGRDFDANGFGDSVGATIGVRHASEVAGRRIDNPTKRIAFDEAIDRIENGSGVALFGRHDTNRQLRGLPGIVTACFRDGDVELVMQAILGTFQHRPLVLE